MKNKIDVTKEGVQFGDCFIYHEAILAGSDPVVKANYSKWLAAALTPCKHKIGTGPEGEDICVHCFEYWENCK